jgi:hypothetical protein
MAEGELSAEQWREDIGELGIAELPLATGDRETATA